MQQLIERTTEYIVHTQQPGGGIPWFEGGIIDPWDHVESAMGLTIGGSIQEAAEAAYQLAENASARREATGWPPTMATRSRTEPGRRPTSSPTSATGVWHHYMATGNAGFPARDLWPVITAALDFVLEPPGERPARSTGHWIPAPGINKDALVTGCSSIYRSLDCGIAIAQVLGEPTPTGNVPGSRLGQRCSKSPNGSTAPGNQKPATPWTGSTRCCPAPSARKRAASGCTGRWEEFVEKGLGCRCVADQPWVTIAETCELIMACSRSGY